MAKLKLSSKAIVLIPLLLPRDKLGLLIGGKSNGVVCRDVMRHARRRQKYIENSLMKRAVLRVAVVDEFTSRRMSARGSLGLEAGADRRKDYKGRGQCGSTTAGETLDGQYKSTNILLWLCRREECTGQHAVSSPRALGSGGGEVNVNVGQRAVNDIPTTLLRGMESRSAVHAAVHDRITRPTTSLPQLIWQA